MYVFFFTIPLKLVRPCLISKHSCLTCNFFFCNYFHHLFFVLVFIEPSFLHFWLHNDVKVTSKRRWFLIQLCSFLNLAMRLRNVPSQFFTFRCFSKSLLSRILVIELGKLVIFKDRNNRYKRSQRSVCMLKRATSFVFKCVLLIQLYFLYL